MLTSEKLHMPWRCQAKTVQYLAPACPPTRASMKLACRDLTPSYVSQNDEEQFLEPPVHYGTPCLVHEHNPLSCGFTQTSGTMKTDIMGTVNHGKRIIMWVSQRT